MKYRVRLPQLSSLHYLRRDAGGADACGGAGGAANGFVDDLICWGATLVDAQRRAGELPVIAWLILGMDNGLALTGEIRS